MLPRQRENSFVSVGRTFQGRKALKQFVAASPVLRHIVAKSPTRLGEGLPHYRGVNCVPGTLVPSRPGTFPPFSLPSPVNCPRRRSHRCLLEAHAHFSSPAASAGDPSLTEDDGG